MIKALRNLHLAAALSMLAIAASLAPPLEAAAPSRRAIASSPRPPPLPCLCGDSLSALSALSGPSSSAPSSSAAFSNDRRLVCNPAMGARYA